MSLYSTILYTGPYGPTNLYTGSGGDQLQDLDFYRTEADGEYVFHWTFLQSFISPAIDNLDYELQLDTNEDFTLPTSFETFTETPINIIAQGFSESAVYAATNASGEILYFQIDGDGFRNITLGVDVGGAAVAADIQAKVKALTANNPALQASYSNFTAVFNVTHNTYTLTSGGTSYTSQVTVYPGPAASLLYLGRSNGGYEIRGNTYILSQLPGGILSVTDSSGLVYLDVSQTTNSPAPGQYVTSLPLGQISFNSVNVPDTITVVYYPSTSAPILDYQDGNVEKGFTVPVPSRIASAPVVFYARVAIKQGNSLGPWSDTLKVLTIPNVILETASRLLNALPDFHVYPTDDQFRLARSLVDGIIYAPGNSVPLPNYLSNIAKVYMAYANEFDTEYLEKENCIRDVRQDRVRDDRIGPILGSLYKYPQPANMVNVDYRLILSNMKAASLDGATYEAVKLVGAAFTGVDPTIFPISKILNFITAGFDPENTGPFYDGNVQNITVNSSFQATLTNGTANDPIIPGSLISGPESLVAVTPTIPLTSPYTITLSPTPASVPTIPGYTFVSTTTLANTETDVISNTFPYIITLQFPPLNIPTISGYSYTTGVPSPTQFTVNFTTGVVTFNAAVANTSVTPSYLYASALPLSGQFNVNFLTGVLTFNAAQAGMTPSITYIPNYLSVLSGETLTINVDSLGPQTVTLEGGPYTTKDQVAAAIEAAVQALGAPPAVTFLGLLAYSTITNVGFTVVTGDVDLYPGTSVTGFPPGTFSGTLNIANPVAQNAMTVATAKYTSGQTAGLAGTTIPSVLDGQTLVPGAYQFASGAATLAASGNASMTFNGAGNYIIYTASTLKTGAGGTATMNLTGGATAANILWVVGSSATLNITNAGAGTFEGNVIAQASITTNGGTIDGSLSALTGAITISNATAVLGAGGPVSPSEETAYTDFLANYNSATDQYTLISGNQNPTSTSTVVVTGGTAATQLSLLAGDGAIQTYGLAYVTPTPSGPAVPTAGQFTNNILTSNGSLLTFPAIEVGNQHTVLFYSANEIFTYLPGKYTETLVVPSVAPYTVTTLYPSCDIPVVAKYDAGTVSTVHNTNTMTGSGTSFLTDYSPGDTVAFSGQMGDSITYTVASVADDFNLTVTSSYTGLTTSGLLSNLSRGYQFVPTPTVVVPPAALPPPVVLLADQWTDNFDSPATLTFNASFVSKVVVVSYTIRVPIQDIDTVKDHPILFSGTEAGFGIEIILNNPGLFTLDLTTIAFLMTEILPATTKFILTEVE